MTTEQQRGAVRLLKAVRQFLAAWEQHNNFLLAKEGPTRQAAADALEVLVGRLEDHARWLEAEMHSCDECFEEVVP